MGILSDIRTGPKGYLSSPDFVPQVKTLRPPPPATVPVAGVESQSDSADASPSIEDKFVDIPDANAVDDATRQGSTRLHLDRSGAVNIMVEDLSGKGALWVIFAPEDINSIRRFLRRKHNLPLSSPCPVHAQQYYLRKDDLRALFTEEGVIPYIFTQMKGQAVLIPAGSAHQVSPPRVFFLQSSYHCNSKI